MISAYLAAHRIPIVLCFSMQVLITADSADRCHGRHSEVISIGADKAEGLLEGQLYFEAQTVDSNDLNRSQIQIVYISRIMPRVG